MRAFQSYHPILETYVRSFGNSYEPTSPAGMTIITILIPNVFYSAPFLCHYQMLIAVRGERITSGRVALPVKAQVRPTTVT